MSDDLIDDEVEVEVEANGALDETSGGIRERLRAARRELESENHIDFIVPGYDRDLAVRFAAIPGDEAEKIAKQLGRKAKGLQVGIRFLIRCCECVLVREDAEGPLEPLTNAGGARLTLSDPELATFLGFEAQTAAQIVMGVYSPEGNRDLAVVDCATSLLNWMQGRGAEIDEALLPE